MLGPLAPSPEQYRPTRSVILPPLSFDHASGGRPVTSQTLLFRLPIELVEEVAACLNTADLRSLALVDRDCRQLARARLFTSVTLEYSDEKWTLLDQLSHHETPSHRDNGGATESPSIGACIRRVRVVPLPPGESSIHNRLSPAETYDDMRKEEGCAAHNAACKYCGTYLPKIAKALRFSLPNLDEFVWPDGVAIPQYMLTAIASSPIRRLGLRVTQLPLDYEYQLPQLEQQRWALQSLDLDVGSHPHSELRGRVMDKFCLTILKAAAPTLEKISFRGYLGAEMSFGNSAIRFPMLRTLSFDTGLIPDDTVLDAFFPTDAENHVPCSVSINISLLHMRESFAPRGRIRGLQSLLLFTTTHDPQDSKATDVALLSANLQLKSLTLLAPKPKKLTTTLLPLLASEFKFLTTLVVYITFPGVHLPPEFFAATGRLTSLTSLWIVASEGYDWTADAPRTIAALSPLRNLARLGLCEQFTSIEVPLVQESEDQYAERMRNIVELYVRAFRGLRWIYFGELVHWIVGNAIVPREMGRRRYSPLGLWEIPGW